MTKETRKTIVKTVGPSYNKDRRKAGDEGLKTFKELTLADRFIFYKVMQDAALCKRLLEMILGLEIERIEYLEGEKTIEVRNDAKGIRLDIYVKDEEATIYNVEMQAAHAANLPQRSRYYQNLIDVDLLGRGVDYRMLNRSFVIFICMEDIFHKGRHIYTFENRCREDKELSLGDGAVKIFLNPYSEMNDVTPELKRFLKYLAEGTATDEYTRKLVEAVETAKRDPRLMVEYMSYYADQADHRAELEESRAASLEEGRKKGREEGREEGIQSFVHMSRKCGIAREIVEENLAEEYQISLKEAAEKVKLYWD